MRITIKSKERYTEEEYITVWYITLIYTHQSNCTTICLNTLEQGLKVKIQGYLSEDTIKDFAIAILFDYYKVIVEHDVIAILEGDENGHR